MLTPCAARQENQKARRELISYAPAWHVSSWLTSAGLTVPSTIGPTDSIKVFAANAAKLQTAIHQASKLPWKGRPGWGPVHKWYNTHNAEQKQVQNMASFFLPFHVLLYQQHMR
jgi:hypothetical protein